jgi:hypothetical protein
MSAPSETIPSLAQTIPNLLKEVKSKAKDDPTQVKSLDTACCLAEAAADITSEVPKITQGNADNDALDSARASVIEADTLQSLSNAMIARCERESAVLLDVCRRMSGRERKTAQRIRVLRMG